MKRHWNYFKYIIRHKWFVFIAGLRVGAPILRLVFHDLSKFRLSEWFPYARTFYKSDGSSQYVETDDFNMAWLLHQHRNKHHWQYWLLRMDNPSIRYTMRGIGKENSIREQCICDGEKQIDNIVIQNNPNPMYPLLASNQYGMHFILSQNNEIVMRSKDIPFKALQTMVDNLNELEREKNDMIVDLISNANSWTGQIAIEMPISIASEMVADWMGAGRAITGKWDIVDWYSNNKGKIVLHSNTRKFVEDLIFGNTLLKNKKMYV